MKLMTKAIEQRFAQVGSQEETPFKEKIIIAKFFNPSGIGTWYATEYNPEERLFFGFCSLFGDHNDEWGYFSLTELESIKTPPFGLGIERDMHFGEKPCGEVNIINCYD